ncbi:hypothetical protein MET9862_02376 [Methylobacterium symbioticum]|uniref:Uncharacterized protein n=1 Tax=Methylobacterium symbioticum TaxID=2584084 RepID=A0A509EC87_9HYPH|nr:hypothetical protein MET9862_02376 [Methylobacterium symbioticum]
MPTRFERFLCWVLFTLAMAGLGWVLHRVVPPIIGWLSATLSPQFVLGVMVGLWIPLAVFVYRGSIAAAFARWRGRIRQR